MADHNQELGTDFNSSERPDELPDHIKRQVHPMIQEAVQRICTQAQSLDAEGRQRIARVLEAAANNPDGPFPLDELQAQCEEFESFVMDD